MRFLTFVLLAVLTSANSFAAVSLSNKNFLYEHDPKLLANTIRLVFRVGSLNDPKGKEGLARLSFLSLLRGTKSKSRVQFISELETLGATADVATNGSATTLMLNVIKENAEPAFRLIAEAVLKPGLRDDEIAQLIAEEKAKLNEARSNNRNLGQRTFRAFLMKGTNWSHPPEGDLRSIDNITVNDIREFLKAQVKSGNLIVVAASNKSEDEVRGLVESGLAKMPEGPATPRPEVVIPERPEGIELVLVPRKGSATTEVFIGHAGMRSTEPDRFALETGNFVFGSEFTSRLTEVLRKQNGWTYGAYALFRMIEQPRRQGGFFIMYAYPQSQHTSLLVPKMLELYDDYVKNGVDDKELQFAINAQSNSYPFQFAEIDNKLNRHLLEITEGYEFPSVTKFRGILKSMSREKVKKAIQKIHTPNRLLAVLVGDPEELEKTKGLMKNVKSVTTIQDPMTDLSL